VRVSSGSAEILTDSRLLTSSIPHPELSHLQNWRFCTNDYIQHGNILWRHGWDCPITCAAGAGFYSIVVKTAPLRS